MATRQPQWGPGSLSRLVDSPECRALVRARSAALRAALAMPAGREKAELMNAVNAAEQELACHHQQPGGAL